MDARTIQIQPLSEANVSDLLDPEAIEVFDYPVQESLALDFLNDPRHHMLLAFHEQTVVGMVSAIHYVHPDKAPQLFVNELGVAKAFRRLGIARALLQELNSLASALGCSEAWVATDLGNEAARKLYQSMADESGEFVMYTWKLKTNQSD